MAGHPYSQDDPVVAQYERWAFPEPVDDLNDPSLKTYLGTFQTLKYLTPAYWPRGAPREDMDILVAGCGTMAGACMAHVYPNHRVIGIDISRSSLAHEEGLKQKYRLTNLTLHRCPVEEVATLGRSFDFISCHGVLHHLPDPAAGLKALAGVLNRDGVIGLMLYAKYGRVPVYMMQELLSLLGLKQTAEDVAVARQVIEGLPADHPLKWSLRPGGTFALGSDAAVVDMFFHPRDTAFSVTDCLSLVRGAGMILQGWDQPHMYYPEATIPAGSALRKQMDGLPDEQLWQAMELLIGRITTHWFYACRADRDPDTYQIPWDSDELLNWTPLRNAQLIKGSSDGQTRYAMGREGAPPVPLTPTQAAIFSQIDGGKTVAQCLMAAAITTGGQTPPLSAARDLLKLAYRAGYGIVCWRK